MHGRGYRRNSLLAAELGDVRHRLEQAQDQMRQMGVSPDWSYGTSAMVTDGSLNDEGPFKVR
jgi:hypothetical protein